MRKIWGFIILFSCILFNEKVFSQNTSLIDSLQRQLNNAHTDLQKTMVLNELCRAYWFSQPKKSLEYGIKAQNLAQKINNLQQESYAYNNQGVAYRVMGKYVQSLNYHLKSLSIREKTKDSLGIAVSFTNIGFVYSMQFADSTALMYYFKSLNFPQTKKDKYLTAVLYTNIAISYEHQQKYEQALDFNLKGLKLCEQMGNERLLGSSYHHLGVIYKQMGKDNLSLLHLSKALKLQKDILNQHGVNETRVEMAKLYLNLNQLDSAKLQAHLAYESAKKLELKEQIRNASEILSIIYQKQKDDTNSLKYLLIYGQYKDSLSNQEIIQKLEFVRYSNELNKKDMTYQLLRAEKENKEVIIKGQRYFVVVILVASLVLLITAIILYQSRKRFQNINQLLKQKTDEIQEKNEELEAIGKVKDRLFSIISHDFRSPLNSIQGVLELLKDGDIGAEELPIFASGLVDKVHHTLNLVDNLLNWARSQMQGLEVNPKVNQLDELVQENIALLAPQAEKKQVRIFNYLTSNLPPVWADTNMLKIILRNLISNAIKFTNENDQIKIKAVVLDNFVKICVEDTGVGISEEYQNKIFRTDTHFTSPGTKNEKGTGLGLILCKDFVEKNGGKIGLMSEENKGTQVFFTVPIAQV